MGLFDETVTRLLPVVPRPLVRQLASPYIAGPTLDDAVAVVRRLNAAGAMATVDVLGEEIRSAREAREIGAEYRRLLARIERERLDANISIKLSGLGLQLDPAVCRANLDAVLDDAAARGIFVRIDMEDASTTDATLALYRELRSQGRENLGVVIQSRLRRSRSDLPGLANVRLCKGIYLEPANIAFTDADEIRAAYLGDLEELFEQGAYVAIATHDELLLTEARARIARRALGHERYEFQMLLGVRAERGRELVRAGERLRVYVPYGRHWYEYSVRRLQENPRVAGYVASDVLRRLLRAARLPV